MGIILSNAPEALLYKIHARNSETFMSTIPTPVYHCQVVNTINVVGQLYTCVGTHVGHIVGKSYPLFGE